MPDRRTLVERTAADVLAGHHLRVEMYDGCFCACGDFSVGRGPGAADRHSEHLAEVLYDAGLLTNSPEQTSHHLPPVQDEASDEGRGTL